MLNHIYDLGLEKMEIGSRKVTARYMTGFIRDYLVYIFAFIILLIGGGMLVFDGFSFDPTYNAPVNFFEVALMISMVITALTVLFSNNRITSIVAVGGLGFLVSFFFVLFRAPDLALTQLVVETVTTALFLLCFYHLPRLRKEISRVQFKAVNAVISIGVGVIVTLVALSANGNRLFSSISSYYENSYKLAGAKNIVNSILVDFRGFDTMLEILVLCIAGIGVYTLIKVRMAKESAQNEGAE
jgi:multicomponent Na+:H+ antiporter subunit A